VLVSQGETRLPPPRYALGKGERRNGLGTLVGFTVSDPPAVIGGDTITLGSDFTGEVRFVSDTGTLKLEESSSRIHARPVEVLTPAGAGLDGGGVGTWRLKQRGRESR
jgi:hypothetical protein